jgi:amino-acid N-acetyltransferase
MNQEDSKAYIEWFRHSSPYINAHRGKTFVLLLEGAAIEHKNFSNIIQDIALLNSLGVKLVLVHGARPQIETRLQRAGIDTHFHQGTRVTCSEALDSVCEASGYLRGHIEALLSMGLPNSPMHLSHLKVCSANVVVAKPKGIHSGVDFLHTGEVRKVDSQCIKELLNLNSVVLVSPLGYSPTGEIFNLQANDVATEVATQLRADKLISFGEQTGLLGQQGELYRELKLSEASFLLDNHKLGEQKGDIEAIIKACQSGVERGHIISYKENGALIKELFSRDGCGSLIYHDSYESIRTATIDDIGGVLELIDPLEQQGILVRRSRELLENEIAKFTVIERDGTIIACAALYPYIKEAQGEVACIVTHPEYRGNNLGERLLSYIEKQAKNIGLGTLFVLTTQTAHWFLEQGFSEVLPADLPQLRRQFYNYQRNSKVFIKPI